MSVIARFGVPVTAFPLGRFLTGTRDVTVELERVVPTGGFTHYVWLVGEGADAVVADLEADETVAAVDVVDELPGRTLVRVDWGSTSTPLFDLVRENGATLVDAEGSRDGWTVDLRVPDRSAVSTFHEECANRGIDAEFRRNYEVGSPRSGDGLGLSAVQRETLVIAFREGYFDVPRRTTIQELAADLGVSEQAVSERIRRALSTLLSGTMHEEDGAGGVEYED